MDNPIVHGRSPAGRFGAPLMRTAVSLLLLTHAGVSVNSATAQTEPNFWRGMFLFGVKEVPSAAGKAKFFAHLSDSLAVNVIQVRVFDDPARMKYFLENNGRLFVLTQHAELASGAAASARRAADDQVNKWAADVYKYPNHLRFYLKDEPVVADLDAYADVQTRIKKSVGEESKRSDAVTAFVHGGKDLAAFVTGTKPRELIIDPYYITNNIPHPSLIGRDAWAKRVGILEWGDREKGYGWYFGYLAQALNKVIEEHFRPAAALVQESKGSMRLMTVPQLHGVFHKATGLYDKDALPHEALSLRPPSPSEIRLQYGIGLAYGTKGIIGYPYGYDARFEELPEAFPGLVSRDPLLTNHSSNFDRLYNKDSVWTGYAEKWAEVARLNRRIKAIEGELATMSWVGAKSWTINTSWEPLTTASPGWKNTIVTAVTATTASKYKDELPQVEIGHLKRGTDDILVVVNRRCTPDDTATINLTLGGGNGWEVADLERSSSPRTIAAGGVLTDPFEPGGFRVYVVRAK